MDISYLWPVVLTLLASAYSSWCRKILSTGCTWIPSLTSEQARICSYKCMFAPPKADILKHPQNVYESTLTDF